MDQLKALSLGRKLVLGGGVLLLIVSFLDWQHASVSINGVTVASGGQSAWHGFWGVLMGLMLVALVAWTAAGAFGVKLPDNIPDGMLTLALGVLIPIFAFIKAISDSYVHWPAWLGVILGLVVAYGAWQVYADGGSQEAPSVPAQDPAA